MLIIDTQLTASEVLRAFHHDEPKLAPSEAIDQMVATVQRWGKSQDDDLTVLVCDFVGAE
jgi:hypothetical protein